MKLDNLNKFSELTKFQGDRVHFKAEARNVGDFAFLRIRHRNDGFLNRELKV